MNYRATIGLEIHVELKTNTKIYCGCKNSFGEKPNTQVCPVCMGLIGALPVLNKKVVDLAVMAGLMLNCTISSESNQDRKHYFYPDLPKAYQISQNETPLCHGGYIEINNKKIRIKRIHIEEDAGKLIHTEHNSFIDFNRCGVPLIEIVTEPDICTSVDAVDFLEALKTTLEYAEISDCKMQEGSLRCDVNVSLSRDNSNTLGTRCEIKNLNSFTAVKGAIDYEISRQKEILNSGNKVQSETRRWDDAKKKTCLMRTKESHHDYRYFPEPDLLPIVVSDEQVEALRKALPELPASRKARFINDYSLPLYDANLITANRFMADFFEECVLLGANAKLISNWLMGDVLKILNEQGSTPDKIPFKPCNLVEMISMINNGTISNSTAKFVLSQMFKTNATPKKIVEDSGLFQISDENKISLFAEEILAKNPQSVEDFKKGNKKAFGFLVGQAMKLSNGSLNPKILNEVIRKKLENQR